MKKPLPPLNAIRVFETAARHLNFARAAEDLGVTHSAVSKQIAILEDYMGGQLFERRKRGVSLTLEGRELRNALAPAFEILSESFQRYSRRPPRSNKFRLATVASFASEFLVPRLRAFEADFPDIELEILTSDRVLDLSREEVDLSVRYGAGEWQGVVSEKLSSGKLVPVYRHQKLTDDERRATPPGVLRRVQVFSTNEWKDRTPTPEDDDFSSQPPIVMEHFLVALQAVLSGVGVALLPEVLVNDRIASGELDEFSERVEWPHAFYLVHPPNAQKVERTRRVMEWFEKAVAEQTT